MENLFKSILDEQLSSVEFVQDYLQLHFDGSTLTCYSWPNIIKGSKSFNFYTIGYRDALCEIITERVTRVSLIEKTQLDIFFENDHHVSLSLKRNDLNAGLAEFIYFFNAEGEWFVLD
ncbi:hypothetical protein [Pedobacter gandavensis]|uniref:hypothetical protein n=1 Tax=Pedobacter gandavensis TaxID=2679963 RepID=UPI00292FCB57|nr:hypothetical protein [Pedobacter gandavensis]